MIPYFRLAKPKSELEALTAVYESGDWAQGKAISEVQEILKLVFNKPYVTLTSNGYAALFLSIKSLGIQNQEIILPALGTCFAISNAIIATGNTPIFCDVNLTDGNCCIESVSMLVKKRNIKHIITPNFGGNISNVSYFKNELKLCVIEDACQSFFSSSKIKSEADVQVFSFYPTKGINGIDGGAIITNNNTLYELAKSAVYYNDQLEYETTEHYNFRFLNLHASVLKSNLNRSNQIFDKLNAIESTYKVILNKSSDITYLKNDISLCNHRFVLQFKNQELKKEIISVFRDNEVSLSLYYIWNCSESEKSKFPNANQLITNCYCIPFFEDLSQKEINIVANTLEDVIKKG